MSFQEHQKKKVIDAADVFITIVVDLALVIGTAFLLTKSVTIVENIIGSPIEESNDKIFYVIYKISKILILTSFVLYVVSNIVLHIIEKYKKLKDAL